jgi:hypothetical protein
VNRYAVVLAIILPGCASQLPPPLQSAWYFQPQGEGPRTQIKIALLNRGAQSLDITRVVLNEGARAWQRCWTFTLEPGELYVMRAQEFVSAAEGACPESADARKQGTFTDGRNIPVSVSVDVSDSTARKQGTFKDGCNIPVSVSVDVSDSTRIQLESARVQLLGKNNNSLQVGMAGSMPSALPAEWDDECPKPSP